MKNTVCFAYTKAELPIDNRLPDRSDLFVDLIARDLQPVVSLGAEKAFVDDRIFASNPFGPDSADSEESVALANVGTLVNRLDRSIKKELLPNPDLPPMVNENAVRVIGYNKERAAYDVLDPLGFGIATSLVGDSEALEQFTDSYQYENYFLKPRHGKFGNGTMHLSKNEVAKYFQENSDAYDKYIIQPAYDFSGSFPAELKAFDTSTSDDYDRLSVAGRSKELRMYGFLSPHGTEVYPAARAVEISADDRRHTSTWFFVDPETLPEKVVTRSKQIIEKTAALTGSVALYGAVDFGYGTADNNDPDWHVIELNALAPGMIANKDNKTVASKLRELFADQLQATVGSVS